jgi:glycosyltransferase involved in cell wall biosynthesis
LCNFGAVEHKKIGISILIPTYNTVCTSFVKTVAEQASKAGIDYEVIVADDASPDPSCIEQDRAIESLPHCTFIVKDANSGAAATRNFLVRMSHYPWLLFLDSDMQLSDPQFINRYLSNLSSPVINGGIAISGDAVKLKSNLRYRYEKAEEPRHTAEKRQQNPYQSFRSANFLIKRETMLQCPFDERFKRSGYEDVLLGKQLCMAHIAITHIDNPLTMTAYEDNDAYVAKIEYSLQTLHRFRAELRGYSRLLTMAERLHINIIRCSIRLLQRCCGSIMRRQLCSSRPMLTVFKLYRLGYFMDLQ